MTIPKHISNTLLSILLVLAAAGIANAQNYTNGVLGQSHPTPLRAGLNYEYDVFAYTFTPGITLVTPSGRTYATNRTHIQKPYHDGNAWVQSTKIRFQAQESGTHQVKVWSHDNTQANQTYTVGGRQDPFAYDRPQQDPKPRVQPRVQPNQHPHPNTGECDPNDPNPNFCGLIHN